MEKKVLFSTAIANKIALRSFGLVLDCVLGYSDTGYELCAVGADFEQNYEEDLEQMGITPTAKRIAKCSDCFDNLIQGFIKMVRAKYY